LSVSASAAQQCNVICIIDQREDREEGEEEPIALYEASETNAGLHCHTHGDTGYAERKSGDGVEEFFLGAETCRLVAGLHIRITASVSSHRQSRRWERVVRGCLYRRVFGCKHREKMPKLCQPQIQRRAYGTL